MTFLVDGADPKAHALASTSSWGLWLEPVSPVRRLVRLAQAAEAAGASHVFVADEGTDRDLYVAMTAILLGTRRIVVSAGITNPFSRHPVATAAAFATLEELAPGRVIAGFGVGGSRVLAPIGLEPARPYTALRETVEVVDALLRGETVRHDGEFRAEATLPWAPGPLPLAMAGRGPRVEQYAVTHADWVILSSKAHEDLPALAASIRARAAAAGHRARIAWSAYLAWTAEMAEAIRPHFTYATVDMPPETRARLGIRDEEAEAIRRVMLDEGIEAAGALVPPAVVERSAIVGSRAAVGDRLAAIRSEARPELFLLPLNSHDGAEAFIEHAANLLDGAGFTG